MNRCRCVCLCLVLAWVCSISAEDRPRFEGKTVREWMTEDLPPDEFGRYCYLPALAQMGPATLEEVPSLLEALKDREGERDHQDKPKRVENRLTQVGIFAATTLAHVGPVARPALLKALRHEHPRVRAGSALALGLMRPRQAEALPALREALRDRDDEVRLHAALAVHRIEGKTEALVASLIDILKSRTPELRKQALAELERLGPAAKAAVPALIDALRDEHLLEAREVEGFSFNWPLSAVARALVAIGPEAAPALREAAADREALVRTHALLALACLPTPDKETLTLLRAALEDRVAEVRLIAAIHLWRHTREAKPVVPVLLELRKDRERVLAVIATDTLARIGAPAREAIPLLVEQLKDEDKGWSAHIALRRFGTEAIPALVQSLGDNTPIKHSSFELTMSDLAASLLSNLKPASIPALLRALEFGNVRVRIAAARELASPQASPRVFAALREASTDIDVRVRFEALVGLARYDELGDPDPVARALADLLKLKGFPHRRHAAQALDRMGHRARKALPVLREAVKDTDPAIRDTVAPLLHKLEPDNRDALTWMVNQIKKNGKDYSRPAPLPAAALPQVVLLVKDRDVHVRANALQALADMPVEIKPLLPLLLAALKEENSDVVAAAAKVLAAKAAADPEVRAALLGLEKRLERMAESTCEEILAALRHTGAEGIAVFRRALADTRLQASASYAALDLGEQGQSLLPVLLPLLSSKEFRTREIATAAFFSIAGSGNLPLKTLRQLLDSPDLSVRRSTAAFLNNRAEEGPALVPLLIEGLRNSDRYAPLPLPNGFVGQHGAYGVDGGPGFRGPFRVTPNFTHIGALGGQGWPSGTGVWGGMRFMEPSGAMIPPAVRSEAALGLRKAGPAARDAIPMLLAMLKGDDPAELTLAATLLGEIGPRAKSAVPILRKLMKDHDRVVRAAAAGALSRLDRTAVEAIPVLAEALREQVRTEGIPGPHIEGLARFGKPAVPILIELLKDRRAVHRLTSPLGWTTGPEGEILAGQAAFALGEIGPEAVEALPALLEILRDRSGMESFPFVLHSVDRLQLWQPSVLETAVRAVGRMGPAAKAAVPLLLEVARDSLASPSLRQKAVEALWRMGEKPEPLMPVVRELLSDRFLLDDFDWLGELGPAAGDAVPVLVRWLDEGNVSAARLLGRLGPRAKPALLNLRTALRAPGAELRTASAVALWRIECKSTEVLPTLLAALRDSDGEDVLAALGGIGKEARDAVPRLRSLLAEGPLSRRILATETVWRITGDTGAVLPVLQRGLESGDPATRRKAVEVLGALGPAARPAADAIKELVEDTERDVRLAAAAALRKIP
jgi:HEAT repeat protein